MSMNLPTTYWGSAGAGVIPVRVSDTGVEVLLQLRSEYVAEPFTWGVFGGRVDPGEQPLDAAIREFHEETDFRGSYTIDPNPVWVFGSPDGAFVYHNFMMIIAGDYEMRLDSFEIDRVQWFPLQSLRDQHAGGYLRTVGDYPLHFGVKHVIPALLDWVVLHDLDDQE